MAVNLNTVKQIDFFRKTLVFLFPKTRNAFYFSVKIGHYTYISLIKYFNEMHMFNDYESNQTK